MLTLIDILKVSQIDIDLDKKFKIHLAVSSTSGSPLSEYFKDTFNKWQSHQTKKNFECVYVISLIRVGKDRWMYAGVFEVKGRKRKNAKHWLYKLDLLSNQFHLIGRVILTYHKEGVRWPYLWGNEIAKEFMLSEYLPERMTIAPYPGHNHVCVSQSELRLIIGQKEKTWFGALYRVKGIYCITDLTNGKQYIGKADGEKGIWQRWSAYVKNGHGENKALRKLLKEKGHDYQENFQFSLLEVADFKTPDKEIGQRESHWKNVLRSREFGYNEN